MAIRARWDRYSLDSLKSGEGVDRWGRLFLSPLGQVNLSGVKFIHRGIDTVKQLYTGTPRLLPFETVQTAYDAGFRQVVDIDGYQWLVGSGRAGGYRYLLRNNDTGVIALLGSLYAQPDKEGAHLKIELSPQYIAAHSVKDAQAELNKLARIFLEMPQASGVAIHPAVDFQGWEPSRDFEERFTTRSKRQASRKGIEGVEFSLNDVAAVYSLRQSFLYGSAASLQFAMYRKDKEIEASDKAHYWKPVWRNAVDDELRPAYDESMPVWRAEFRFHHRVIQEFAAGIGETLNTYEAVSKHLNGLWLYALDSYRLDASRTYIDPFWQLLGEDVQFSEPNPNLLYKRVRKAPGVGGKRNVAAALGNLIAVYAKNGLTSKEALHYLQNSGMWSDLLNWQMDKQMSKAMFFEWLAYQLNVRRLLGKAA